MILTILFFLILPLAVGLVVFCLSQKIKKTGVLLFHRISKNYPQSLSQVSTKQFYEFCEQVCLSGKKSVVFSQYSMQNNNNISIAFDDGDKSVFDIAYPILKKYNWVATVFVASGIITNQKVYDFYSTKNMMSDENIKELSDCGWEIASHGARHLDLTLLNENDLRNELICSKSDLEELTGKVVSALSFPYGSWNEKIVETARDCGYKKFAIYRKHKFADNEKIIPATAVYPFDNATDIKYKISGEIIGITKATSLVIPHFAKGTPIFFWNKLYRIPFFTKSYFSL